MWGAPPPFVPEAEQNNKWLEKMLTLKRLYVHYLTATGVLRWPIALLLVAADGVTRGERRLPGGREVEAAVTDEDGGNDRDKWSFRGGWRRPWLDGGCRSGRRLPRRMETAVADGTAPSSDGGDSGRAAAMDGVARGG